MTIFLNDEIKIPETDDALKAMSGVVLHIAYILNNMTNEGNYKYYKEYLSYLLCSCNSLSMAYDIKVKKEEEYI